MKYFCENTPEYHVVCAGSLLGIALQRSLSFPVGKVEFLTLYPMSFAEFLRAAGTESLADFAESFKKGDDLPELIGEKLSTFLKQYYITGGMPEAVRIWFINVIIVILNQRVLQKQKNTKQNILD